MEKRHNFITPAILIVAALIVVGLLLIERSLEITPDEYQALEAPLKDPSFVTSRQGRLYFTTLNEAYFPGHKITRSEQRKIIAIYNDWTLFEASDVLRKSLEAEARRISDFQREKLCPEPIPQKIDGKVEDYRQRQATSHPVISI